MIKRVLAAFVLAAIGIPAIILGGVFYYFLVALIMGVAAWEFHHIFCAIDCNASQPLLIGSVVLIVLTRAFFPTLATAALTFSILAVMTWHLFDYEKGRDKAATDFTFSAAGIVYIGWIGAYLIDIRNLPDGMWWLLLVFPAVWLADTSAFFVGSRWGKGHLSPRLSPKKTWEGYWAGVFFGTFVLPCWQFYGTASEVRWCHGGREHCWGLRSPFSLSWVTWASPCSNARQASRIQVISSPVMGRIRPD